MNHVKPLTRMRRAISKSMSASAGIPQFTIEMELDTTVLARSREQLRGSDRPSYTDALIASVAQALVSHPALNSTYTDDGIVEHEAINIALALDLGDGLISPVIADADGRSIGRLAAERKRVAESARAGTLKPDDVLSATFTISNLGPLGVRRFRALVVPPQAAILAVGSVDQEVMPLSLSVDHRAVDGAPAARFLLQVKKQLEDDEWIGRLFEGAAPIPLYTSV